ncbi:thioredoxin fold domain-containing protein [Acidithiobacillus ferridurans]|uniref:Thioredoxin fold domain-containing protein n=1 Tax=Acidithiobacillus ferridurans TaxID=1232575 RepID=A0A8X8KB32_ACIFI|nr:thioredoxin fold domain-containing protein [Acidithiobacillus ferridurans]MBU2715831.1 thioredoxin fold domain-containing protein [Acidithiobacillus ferridurans]MBU2722828.1 thioredoxin fold domain-containing protein [Acidithiobacillus ferridurans]MBU2727785.1 thioredoxin fold domain-containing protein [Acidithiobacillus ferridurans]
MKKIRFRLSVVGISMAIMGTGAGGLAIAGGMQGGRTVPAKAPYSAVASLHAAQTLIQSVTHGTMQVVNVFPGPQSNITGILAKPRLSGVRVNGAGIQGRPVIAWMVDNQYLTPGVLLGASGQNFTFQAALKMGLIQKPMAPQKLAQDTLRSPGFTIGKSGPLMVAFMDPNCSFCHVFWDAVQPEVAAGKLLVKVVPAGFLRPSSLPKAVTILMQKSPAQAWGYDEVHFHVHTEEGGTVPVKHLDPQVSAEIRANTTLLARTGEVATPTVVACENGQKLPTILHGLPTGGLKALLGGAQSLQKNGTCGASS